MTITYYGYPKCGTCRKAKKWLDDQGVDYIEHNIAENPPTAEQLKEYVENSGLPLKKFFNTSGMKYKELNLKDKLLSMSEQEQIELLSSDGMLIKRPIVTNGHKVTVGFKENEFEEAWNV